MIKFSFCTLAIVLLLAGCSRKTAYTVQGTVANKNYNGTHVYLHQPMDEGYEKMDSILISDGKFSLSSHAKTPFLQFAVLTMTKVRPQGEIGRLILIEPGKKINIRFDSIITVTGSQANESFDAFKKKESGVLENLGRLGNALDSADANPSTTEAEREKIIEAYKEQQEILKGYNYDFIDANISNKLGRYELLGKLKNLSKEKQQALLNKTDETLKSHPKLAAILKNLQEPEKAPIGAPFIDLQLSDTAGNTKSLSDYVGKGKTVLIDFWASWCIPCVRALPDLRILYDKFHTRGFDIVGISHDNYPEDWKNAINKYNLPWHHLSNLNAEDPAGNKEYGIEGIPFTVLIDGNGKIIGKNLSKEELKKILSTLP